MDIEIVQDLIILEQKNDMCVLQNQTSYMFRVHLERWSARAKNGWTKFDSAWSLNYEESIICIYLVPEYIGLLTHLLSSYLSI